ncbi:uncharacterized protein LOC109713843 [Ananas comosus]|uniref:Uncharacterized protein LOC109713843 n=1 Tax=Ananas comosus TaxID=4615 RepID=A0A6P5FDG7_ANACO|nr:uncharacterized protein LOC109713843 [Ananas comosus]
MARRQSEANGARRSLWVLLFMVFVFCSVAYIGLSAAMRPRRGDSSSSVVDSGRGAKEGAKEEEEEEEVGKCCRGIEGLELWGAAVKWGSDHRFDSARGCCRACEAMCPAASSDRPCLCNSWVFCGDRARCGDRFGECWLKKQEDVLFPAVAAIGENVMWTSGLIFGEGEGIIGLETDYGTLHVKLLPACAPRSVSYISELLQSRHSAGCQIYRAEDRGNSWDLNGFHIADASFGPPYALLQGTLEGEGIPFKNIPTEACPTIKRGSVAWVGSGPEFFISLANHYEWRKAYTVFGSVLPKSMEIAEKIASLPTKPDIWKSFNVSVLKKPINIKIKRITKGTKSSFHES